MAPPPNIDSWWWIHPPILYTPRICLTIPYHIESRRVVPGMHTSPNYWDFYLWAFLSHTVLVASFSITWRADYNVGTLRETSMSLDNLPGLSPTLTPTPMQMVATGFPASVYYSHFTLWIGITPSVLDQYLDLLHTSQGNIGLLV